MWATCDPEQWKNPADPSYAVVEESVLDVGVLRHRTSPSASADVW